MSRPLFTFFLALSTPTAFTAQPAYAEDAAAGLPPPSLALSVTPEPGGPWKLRIENTGDVPLRIAADPRLLVLEVTPPAGTPGTAPKPPPKRAAATKTAEPATSVTLRCVLPDDARPSSDEGRELVIPGKRSWSARVDPLLYCFGARERAALVSGASVKARFGWPSPPMSTAAAAAAARRAKSRGGTSTPAPLAPPFAATPVGAAVGKHAPAKDLEGNTFVLGESPLATGAAEAQPAPPASAAASGAVLNVSIPETLDVARGVGITTTVTVANSGDRPAVLLFRPETIRFAVSGPAGSVACGTTRVVGSPIRELYSTIPVKGRTSTTLLLTAVCPPDTFAESGIYRVKAILDTTGASARAIGLKTWDDEATSRAPMLLRVRTSRQASTSVTRAALD